LLRLDRLYATVGPLKQDAIATGRVPQCESAPVVRQTGKFLDEPVLAHSQKHRQPGDFTVAKTHLAGPSTTGGTALAFMEDRHRGFI